MSLLNTDGFSMFQQEDKKKFDSFRVAEAFANELFKSELANKITITYMDICNGNRIENDKKFSLKVSGCVAQSDINECEYLKGIFQNLLSENTNTKDMVGILMKLFWEVTVDQPYGVGSRFTPIEGSFNKYSQRQTIEHTAGRVLLLDIWATWCGYCHDPMTENIAINKELSKLVSNVDIVGLSCDKDTDQKQWIAFCRTKKWEEIIQLRNRNILGIIGISSIPHIIIVDKNGKIRYAGHPKSAGNIKELLEKLANEDEKQSTLENDSIDEDPNPFWKENIVEDREVIIDTINEVVQERNFPDVKFVVKTKCLYKDSKVYFSSIPHFTGKIIKGQMEDLKELDTIITENFGLNNIKYQIEEVPESNHKAIDLLALLQMAMLNK